MGFGGHCADGGDEIPVEFDTTRYPGLHGGALAKLQRERLFGRFGLAHSLFSGHPWIPHALRRPSVNFIIQSGLMRADGEFAGGVQGGAALHFPAAVRGAPSPLWILWAQQERSTCPFSTEVSWDGEWQ